MKRLMPHTEEIIAAEIVRAARDNSVVPERRKIAISDQKGLLYLDIRHVLTNEIEVFDDRSR